MSTPQTLYVIPNPTTEDREWCVISEHPVFGGHQGIFNEDGDPLEAVAVPFDEIPDLIRRLRAAYNTHKGLPDPSSFNAQRDPNEELGLVVRFDSA